MLGEVDLDGLLGQREKLNVRLQSILDQHTSTWGVKVTMVEVKQVDLSEQMIRVLGRQAEAERERRAKIIHAEGEYTAAEKLAMAAEVIQKQPAAIQLRYLQTLVEIGAEKNTTIVFPLPLDIIASLGRALDRVFVVVVLFALAFVMGHGIFDWLLSIFGRKPYWCQFCNIRFNFIQVQPA